MSEFARAFYTDLLDTDDPEELDHAMSEWASTTPSERSFVQVQLLWLIHGQLAELTVETTTLSEVLRLLNSKQETVEPETIDAEVVDE